MNKFFKVFFVNILKHIKDRFKMLLKIPAVYRKLINKKISGGDGKNVLFDLAVLFFRYKLSPDCYYICRLWSVDREEWTYYYGSNYRQPQKTKLEQIVQPPKYSILFSDKYICQKLCVSIGVPTPKTYGIFYPDQDYREILLKIIKKLGIKKLFIKPVIGGGGKGISVAELMDQDVFIRTQDKILELKEFTIKFPVIFQEAINQNYKLSLLSSQSVNTVRVATIYTKEHKAQIVAAFLRCGVGRSYIDNWSAGGIAIGVDIEKGQLMRYGFDKDANLWDKHPTSGIIFDGFQIPNWSQVIEVAKKVQLSFPCFRILGLDIAISDKEEPIIIEVNDYPDLLVHEQVSGGLLKNKSNLLEFGRYGLLINKFQERLYKCLLDNT